MVPADLQLAQLNIALPREPIDSPMLAEFVALLDPVNALADAAPGFVWRLQGDDGNATSVRGFDDDRVIVNLSVWQSIQSLSDFVYRSGHLEVMRRRREWMERIPQHIVLWWVPTGHCPSVDDAESRLAHLRERGPTPHAFTFKSRFEPGQALLIEHEIGCPA